MSVPVSNANIVDPPPSGQLAPVPPEATRGSGGGDGALREVIAAYKQLISVIRLPAVWALTAFLLRWDLGVSGEYCASGGYCVSGGYWEYY